jgi:hypothetical protein
MRTARDRSQSKAIDLFPEMRTCPACKSTLRERYRKERCIVRLNGILQVTSHFLHCTMPVCVMNGATYRPATEDLLAMRGATFGLDVVAAIGELRFRENLTLLQIQERLSGRCRISIKEVELLCEVFLSMVTTKASTDPKIREELREQGGIVLSIDGVQPEKGNETLYILRDVISGRVLAARNLLSSATSEIEALFEEVKAMGVPIIGLVSDKQHSFVAAAARAFPNIPHQICQYHYMRDLTLPIIEADRAMKKELRAKIRGIRSIERSFVSSSDRDAPIIMDYCLAVREVMRDDGRYPFHPPGVRLYDRLSLIAASVQRSLARRKSDGLQRLANLLTAITPFTERATKLQQAFAWIGEVQGILEEESEGLQSQKRLMEKVSAIEKDHACFFWAEHLSKLTDSFSPRLFVYRQIPELPKTNNDLEIFIGRLKKSRRHVTGRKNTQAFVLREGGAAAILYGLPKETHWGDFILEADRDAFVQNLETLRRRAQRKKTWSIKRKMPIFLESLEGRYAA